MSDTKNSILKHLAIAIASATVVAIGFVVFSLNTKNQNEELPTDKVAQPTPTETKKTTKSISAKRNISTIKNNEQQNVFNNSKNSDDEKAEEFADQALAMHRYRTKEQQQKSLETKMSILQATIDRFKKLSPEELQKVKDQIAEAKKNMEGILPSKEKIDAALNQKMTNEEKEFYRPLKELEEELRLLLE